jgi:signal transduction histidine kinase/FixJ family two-component response regulator
MSNPPSTNATVHPIRDAIWVSVFVFLGAAVAIGWLYFRAHDAQMKGIREDLGRMARVAASTVDGNKLAELRSPDQEGSAEHKATLAPLVAFHRSVPELSYVYAVTIRGGRPHFILDTATEKVALGFHRPMAPSGLMEVYNDADPFMLRALTRGSVETTDKLFSDEYGTFLSGFAPIRDDKNELVGVVGVDLEVSDLQARIRGLNIAAGGAGTLSALTAILLGMLVGYVRRRAKEAESSRNLAESTNVELIDELRENLDLIRDAAEVNRTLLEAKDFEGAIPEVLRLVGTSYEVDRAYVFRRHPHPKTGRPAASQIFKWCRDNVKSEPDNLVTHDIDLENCGLAEWTRELDAGRDIAAHTKDLPEPARKLLEAQEVTTVLMTPIMVNQTCWGFIGFDQCSEEQDWTPEERVILSNTSDALGTAFVRIEAENRLKENRNLLDGVLAASADGILAFKALRDPEQTLTDFELVLANPAAGNLLNGIDLTKPGAHLSEILPQSISDSLIPDLAEVVRTGEPLNLERQLQSGEAEQWLHLIGTKLDDGITLTVSDITHSKEATHEIIRAKDAAEAADRAKSEFLAVMSHEIRTPMNGVIGFTNLLMETHLESNQKEYVETIRQCGDSLLNLINDILDFSKIEAGHVELESNPLSLNKCIEDVVYLSKQSATTRSLRLKTEIDPSLPEFVFGDFHRLRQILLNLVGNAVKFTKQGSITVRAKRDPEAKFDGSAVPVNFEVSDTGIGIPQDKLPRLFKPFSQADSSTTRRYGGTGLGLAICRRLVELMRGEISVESTAETGSTFKFTIPLDPVPTDATGSKDPSQEPVRKKTDRDFGRDHPLEILIAEDNRVNQQLVNLVLSRMGYRPDIAPNGRVAKEAAANKVYDVILMDVQMPEVDGFEATRLIREHEGTSGGSEHPAYIIALTADAMQGDRDRCIQAGMNDYLSKPLRAADLREALERCWAERRPKRPAQEDASEATTADTESPD